MKKLETKRNRLRAKKMLVFMLVALFIGIVNISCNSDKEYNDAISTADNYFAEEKYDDAKDYYLKALELKEGDKYSIQKMSEIDNILAVKNELQYLKEIENADGQFANKNYRKAKNIYTNASELIPDKEYPKQKIAEIDLLLTELKKQNQAKKFPFHIIAGSFKIESNALSMQNKIKANGNKAEIIKAVNGFNLVSIKSYATITDAYNDLEKAKMQYNERVWVYLNK